MKQFRAAAAVAVIAGSGLTVPALADEADKSGAAAPGLPTLSSVLDASAINVNGYVASSYYHSNGYNTYHEFDVGHDTFQLDQAALTIAYQPKTGFGAVVNVAAGEDMRVLHAAEDGNDNSFDLIQGFLQYAGGPLTVIAGKYVTLAGAEVIAPTGNTNFSRSFLFYAEPLTHTGVRATYAASDALSLIVGVNNGWDTTSTSYGSKTAELGLAYVRGKQFTLTAQAYLGKEPGYDAERTLVDLVATYNATDALTLVLNYDWGQQKQVYSLPSFTWNGLAGYANYALTERLRLSLRAEYLNDDDGFVTGSPQRLKEGTVTFGFAPVKNFELRLEARYDKSNDTTFVRMLRPGETSILAADQTEFAVQGVYKF